MMRVLFYIGAIFLALVLAYSMLWGALAIWYRLPVPEFAKYVVITVFLIPGFFALVHIFNRRTLRSLIVYAVFLAALLTWWQTLRPPAEADWAKEVARQVTGTIDGEILALDGVRAFEWRTEQDATENWVTRRYDLSKLETLDLFLSYWGDPKMAHFILSFGFSDGQFLAWSIEVRRLRAGAYSPLADFFKANPLAIIAAEEWDVVGVRSIIRGQDVHIFRLNTSKEDMRLLLKGYVEDANYLAARPQWYNSLFSNCTTVVFKTIEALGQRVPFDWRIIVNGYLPELFHERGVVNTEISVEELRALGRIAERAKAVGLTPAFSAAIREGVPTP